MTHPAERAFLWAVLAAAIAGIAARVGFPFAVLDYLPQVFLAAAAVSALMLVRQAGGISLTNNRLRAYAVGFLIAAAIALVIWMCSEKWAQDALPWLKAQKKLWKTIGPLGLFMAVVFALFSVALAAIGKRDDGLQAPGHLEKTLAVNLPAKIAAVPMVATALVIFVGATGWTIVHSFTNSKLLPKLNFVGLDQYERLWTTNRWIVSIENLAIYGICSLIFSLVIGFVLAALLDQKIRFENTFRTIFLYPFALSFIVTGLVWQWLLNPEFGVQSIVRSLGFETFTFDPLYNADIVIFGVLIAGLWQGTGLIMCLMLAGLRGIDEDIWKAARVDGIPTWKTYLFIIIPMMRPVFITTLVLIASGIIRVYDLVVAQTSGGPGIASEVPAKYVYDMMFLAQNLGQGFAASTMMLLAVLVVLIPWAYLEFGGKRRV